MSPELVGAVAVGVMLLLMFLGLPIAICMILVGSVGFAILVGGNQALAMAGMTASCDCQRLYICCLARLFAYG